MKKLQRISRIVLLIGILVFAVNWFYTPLPDWPIRIAGLFLLLAVGIHTYCSVRIRMDR